MLSTSHSENEITVQLSDKRQITYNPKRLSGVSVYKEATRQFAVGDRIQFRAPFEGAKVKNTELATVMNIADGEFTVALSGDRVITFNPARFPHVDHGYAVTSYSSQGKTMDRVLVNAETTETDLLVNQRMAYVAVSRARLDARIYTDSAADLGGALARRKDKTMALEALQQVRSGASNDNGPGNDSRTHGMQHPEPAAGSDEACSIARLKARVIVGESNVAVAQKRLNDFAKSKHLYSFDIAGEQWSLVRVDCQQRIKERQIDYSKRAISAYRMRLYGAINNPLKLYGLREYKENATRGKVQLKEGRGQVETLQQIHKIVTSCLEERRVGLQTELRTETESLQKLNHTLDLKPDLPGTFPKETALPEFTERELDRLEANAKTLRDPKMLQTAFHHSQRQCGLTLGGTGRIASKAAETLASANTWLTNINDRIKSFSENREVFPVLFETTNGEEQTATVRELAQQTTGQNVLSRMFSDSHSQLEAVKEALNQRDLDLLQERTSLQSFIKAAGEIVDYYRELGEGVNWSTGQVHAVSKDTDTALGKVGPRSGAADGKQTQQSFGDDHLKQIRQAIDQISLSGASNESGIEVGIAETETAASESLAALI